MKKSLIAIGIATGLATAMPVYAQQGSGSQQGQGSQSMKSQQQGGQSQQSMNRQSQMGGQGQTSGQSQMRGQQQSGQGQQMSGQSQMRGQQQSGQGQQAKQGHRAVIGQVVDTRVVQVRGQQGSTAQHRLVKLQNQQGEMIVVDLGNANRVGAPQRGATLAVTGKEARINNRPVLFASYVGDLHPAGAVTGRSQMSGR